MFLDIKTEEAIEKAVMLEEIEAIKQKAVADFTASFDEQTDHARFLIERFYSSHKDKPIEHLTKSVSSMMEEIKGASDSVQREYWRSLLLEKLELEREYIRKVQKQFLERLPKVPLSEYMKELRIIVRMHEAVADVDETFLARTVQVVEILDKISQRRTRLGLTSYKMPKFGKHKYILYNKALGQIKEALQDCYKLPMDRPVTSDEANLIFILNPMLPLPHLDRPRRLDIYIKNLDENAVNEVSSYVKMQAEELRVNAAGNRNNNNF